MHSFDLFECLEQAQGSKEKVAILKEAGDIDKLCLRWALDPDLVYHLTYLPDFQAVDPGLYFGRTSDTSTATVAGSTEPATFNEFSHFIITLSAKRALTNEHRARVGEFLARCDERARKWCGRILLKDLRCGIDVKTVNKALPGLIETWDVALANTWDHDKHAPLLGQGAVADVKLDGFRCTVVISDDLDGHRTAVMRTRGGKLLTTFPHIAEEMVRYLPPGVYDGEVYWHDKDGFQKLMSYARADRVAPVDLPVRFILFDKVRLDQWQQPELPSSDTYRMRRISLVKDTAFTCVGEPPPPGLDQFLRYAGRYLGITTLHPVEDLAYLGVLADRVMDLGFEGLMVKNPEARYAKRRTDNVLKVKRFESREATVTGLEPGTGRLERTLGALVCQFNGQEFRIGTGFDDFARDRIWVDGLANVGRSVEFKSQGLTKDGIPRFPVFIRFRTDIEGGFHGPA